MKNPLSPSRLMSLLAMIGLLVSIAASQPSAARPSRPQAPSLLQGAAPQAETAQRVRSEIINAKQNDFISYAEPHETLLHSLAQQRLSPNASPAELEAETHKIRRELHEKAPHGPRPEAYQRLLHNEQRALAAGSSPAALGLGVTGTLRLFVVAVEFDGTDTFNNFSHPISVNDRRCITETVTFTGPLHNQIPAPGPRDNFSIWQPDFDKTYYENLVVSTTGITERLRMDLTDPEDGKPGIDLSGQSMRNYYEEVSGYRVKFDTGPRGVIAWLKVPHSEGYYAANACFGGDAGIVQGMHGLPSNPRFPSGPGQLLVDIVEQIKAADPNFPWADYDVNGDRVIDHVVIFHAGKDRSSGGGKEDYQAIWAHRGNVDPQTGGYSVDSRGTTDPSDDIRLFGYTIQYEDAGIGVLVHEFGHDLGLPDLYDVSGGGESSVGWWDLMSSGSYTGKLLGSHPTHLSTWSKMALGWAEPRIINPTTDMSDVVLGQTSNPPPGTTQAVQVNLPPTVITNTQLLPGSTKAWWTNNDLSWPDIRLTRDVDLTGQTAPISISFDIEGSGTPHWSFTLLEVSLDGGRTYTQTKGFQVGTNVELTTPDDYPDPIGVLAYLGLTHGYTGNFGGTWVRVYHDLSPFAGSKIKLRFRHVSFNALGERGYFIDNIRINSASTVILNDLVEDNSGWTATAFNLGGLLPGAGWVLSNGVAQKPLYYLLEWRNANGFDEGLRYTYNVVLFNQLNNEVRVDHVPANAPGMLVWLRDTRYGGDPGNADNSIYVSSRFGTGWSEGPKGGLLLVDSHPEPLRAPVNATFPGQPGVPYPPGSNWNGRTQLVNAAFSLNNTPSITLTLAGNTQTVTTTVYTATNYAPLPSIQGFHDALGYYPGVEALPQPIRVYSDTTNRWVPPYVFADADASVVIPAKGYYPPRLPPGFTGMGPDSTPLYRTYETFYRSAFGNHPISIGQAGGFEVTGQFDGNPGTLNVQHGYHFQIVDQAPSGRYGRVRLWKNPFSAVVDSSITLNGEFFSTAPVTVNVMAQNVGSRGSLAIYSDFDERRATYVEGSATNGAIPVRASPAQVQAVLDQQGIAGLQSLQAAPGKATAVIWLGSAMNTGQTAAFSYQLAREAGSPVVRVVNQALGTSFNVDSTEQLGYTLFLTLLPR